MAYKSTNADLGDIDTQYISSKCQFSSKPANAILGAVEARGPTDGRTLRIGCHGKQQRRSLSRHYASHVHSSCDYNGAHACTSGTTVALPNW